jgi:hypothetical protein
VNWNKGGNVFLKNKINTPELTLDFDQRDHFVVYGVADVFPRVRGLEPRENQSAYNVTAVDFDTVVRFQQFAVPQPLDRAVGARDLALQDKVISGHKNVLLWRSGVPNDLHRGLWGRTNMGGVR